MRLKSLFSAACTCEEAFSFVASADAMLLFGGFWPVPGIRKVDFLDNGRLRVLATRSPHEERVTGYKKGTSLTMDIYPTGIVSWLCLRIREIWLFRSVEGEARVQRFFVFEPRRFASPLLLMLRPFFTRAIEKNNEDLALALSQQRKADRPFPDSVLNSFRSSV